MLKWLRRRLWRNRRPVERTWWIPSPPYVELPPLANDALFEMRICRDNISEFRVPTQ